MQGTKVVRSRRGGSSPIENLQLQNRHEGKSKYRTSRTTEIEGRQSEVHRPLSRRDSRRLHSSIALDADNPDEHTERQDPLAAGKKTLSVRHRSKASKKSSKPKVTTKTISARKRKELPSEVKRNIGIECDPPQPARPRTSDTDRVESRPSRTRKIILKGTKSNVKNVSW